MLNQWSSSEQCNLVNYFYLKILNNPFRRFEDVVGGICLVYYEINEIMHELQKQKNKNFALEEAKLEGLELSSN